MDMIPFHWLENETVDHAVTSVSSYAAFPQNGFPSGQFQLRVANSGSKVARIRKAVDATASALVTDMPILPGAVEVFTINNAKGTLKGLVAICSGTDTTTLSYTIGAGI